MNTPKNPLPPGTSGSALRWIEGEQTRVLIRISGRNVAYMRAETALHLDGSLGIVFSRRMVEQTVKIIERCRSRVYIVRREDGTYTFRTQLSAGDGWGSVGLDCGIYHSAETAESEARSKVWWLAND